MYYAHDVYYRQPRLVDSDTYSATILMVDLRVVSMATNIDIFGKEKMLIIMCIGINFCIFYVHGSSAGLTIEQTNHSV